MSRQNETLKLSNASIFEAVLIINGEERKFPSTTSFDRYASREKYEYYTLNFIRLAYTNTPALRQYRTRIYKVDLVGQEANDLGLLESKELRQKIYELEYDSENDCLNQLFDEK